MAGGADVILIPEIPYDLDRIAEKVRERERHGRRFSIVVVAEGAQPAPAGSPATWTAAAATAASPTGWPTRSSVATGKETRTLALGHIQRGGTPIAYDRNLALRFGAAAVRGARGTWGMVALQGNRARRPPRRRDQRDQAGPGRRGAGEHRSPARRLVRRLRNGGPLPLSPSDCAFGRKEGLTQRRRAAEKRWCFLCGSASLREAKSV